MYFWLNNYIWLSLKLLFPKISGTLNNPVFIPNHCNTRDSIINSINNIIKAISINKEAILGKKTKKNINSEIQYKKSELEF